MRKHMVGMITLSCSLELPAALTWSARCALSNLARAKDSSHCLLSVRPMVSVFVLSFNGLFGPLLVAKPHPLSSLSSVARLTSQINISSVVNSML